MGEIEELIVGKKIESFEQICNEYDDANTREDEYLLLGNAEFKDILFKKEIKITISQQARVIFKNCVFQERVQFAMADDSEVDIYSCFIADVLSFGKNAPGLADVHIDNSRINKLVIRKNIGRIDAYNNIILELSLNFNNEWIVFEHDYIFSIMRLINNCGDKRKVFFNCEYGMLVVDSLSNVKRVEMLIEAEQLDYNPDLLTPKDRCQEKKEIYETLLATSDISYDRNKYAEFMYRKRLSSASNRMGVFWVFITQGFMKPLWFVILFTMVFFISALLFINICGASVGDAFYQSGITITTLGYENIIGGGCAKVISVVESFVGMILASCFFASIVNKYTD